MAKIGVSIKLDVTKIDKSRLFKGEKGTYLDLTTFVDLDNVDQYNNNGFIAQSVSKEEREQGLKGTILGNCRVFFNDAGQQQNVQATANPATVKDDSFDDDIPF